MSMEGSSLCIFSLQIANFKSFANRTFSFSVVCDVSLIILSSSSVNFYFVCERAHTIITLRCVLISGSQVWLTEFAWPAVLTQSSKCTLESSCGYHSEHLSCLPVTQYLLNSLLT